MLLSILREDFDCLKQTECIKVFKMINFTTHHNQEGVITLCSKDMNIEKNEETIFTFNLYFFVSINVILSLTAMSGNILILIALQKDSPLHPPSKLLFRCLSFTDLCVGLISQPIFVTYLMMVKNKNWDICRITEGLAYALSTVLCGESISILTAISVDRLLALLLRLRYRQVVTLTRVRIFVIISWITNIAFSLTYMLDKQFFFIGGCACIWLCLSISTCCYAKIYFTLRHHQAQIQSDLRGDNLGTSGINMARYKNTVSSTSWIHLALLVCYVPYTIATAVSTLGVLSLSNVSAWNITGILVFFNSSLNPFLYCWKISEVRQAVKATIRQMNIFSHNE